MTVSTRSTLFERLAFLTAAATYVLVVIGAIVRSTGSGMGCPDWPLCHGQIIPPLGDNAAWIEWIHRGVAAVIGFLVLALVIVALRSYRRRLSIVVPTVAALLLTVFQAWLGKITVDTNNAGEWVTAHLAAALALLALLTFVAVRARYPAELPPRGASQRMTLLLAFVAASIYALLLFGSQVTALGPAASLIFADWPLFNGQLLPSFSADPAIAGLQMAHFLHRLVAGIVGVFVLAAAIIVWRAVRVARRGPARARRRVRRPDQATHHRAAAGHHGAGHVPGRARRPAARPRAVDAARRHAGRRRRERDQLLHRPRHRRAHDPDAAPAAARARGRAGERARLRDFVLGVVAFATHGTGSTNLVAAFLTLLAMAFYVVVYTMLLKRSTPQNIVLGGAAGALPPVIGWAAVTGDIGSRAAPLRDRLLLDAAALLGALAAPPARLRRGGGADAAGVHGVPETTRQIALYSVLMVCLTLVFFAVARMGLVFLAGALVLGGLFLLQALAMWRDGTDARAVRLYRYSITYLTALFGLIILDVFVFLPL
jgi:heme A synthase/4-hydroxybenzoate polyprenyltransferase